MGQPEELLQAGDGGMLVSPALIRKQKVNGCPMFRMINTNYQQKESIMGWTHTNRPHWQTPTEFIKEHFSWDGEKYTCKVIETSVKLDVAFAAVEQIEKATGNREVWALVLLLHHMPKSYYNFGYKDMDETVGPFRYDCPAKILDLLTPTDNEYALQWRAKCRELLDKKQALPVGTTIKFCETIGNWGDTFTKVKYGRKRNVFRTQAGSLLRLNWALKYVSFTIIGKEVAA